MKVVPRSSNLHHGPVDAHLQRLIEFDLGSKITQSWKFFLNVLGKELRAIPNPFQIALGQQREKSGPRRHRLLDEFELDGGLSGRPTGKALDQGPALLWAQIRRALLHALVRIVEGDQKSF